MNQEIETKGLVIGWRGISVAVGRSAQYLAQAFSNGRLPVVPIKIGTTVAMTAEMIDELRAALTTRSSREQGNQGETK